VTGALAVSGITFEADCAGALYWPEEGLLAVADLHFEKGSSYARRGMLLPPYDTAETLAALGDLIARYAPRIVVALGDSFHDGGGPARLSDKDRGTLTTLQSGRDWIWIAGNHDPDPSSEIGGTFAQTLSVGPLTFRHIPEGSDGEIAGHLHPSARVSVRGHSIVRPCFAADATRLVMPAFGAYTGGLSIRDRAFAAVFGACDFTAHLLGRRRIYAFPAAHCA
jgi:DNA ligase-associated metallophosphoesterase